jgi:hypothetical protein
MTHSKQVVPVTVNKMAKAAGWASGVNIVSWLLVAIPGFLSSPWAAIELVFIPGSALLARAAGIMGLVSKVKISERGAGQCVIGISIGVVNALTIGLVLVVILYW